MKCSAIAKLTLYPLCDLLALGLCSMFVSEKTPRPFRNKSETSIDECITHNTIYFKLIGSSIILSHE